MAHLSPEDFRREAHEVVDWIADYLADIRNYPVLPKVQPGDLTDQLPPSGPDAPESIERIMTDFSRLVAPANTHWNHPRFHAYFSVSASGAGILGEMLTAALNVNAMQWKTSPAATELEQVTVSWLRQWLGLPAEFFGMIHDSASIAVMHAIAAAREQACPEIRKRGFEPNLILYVSEHAHSSIEKSAMTLGIGCDNVRRIATDAHMAMDPAALSRAVEADRRAGLRPFAIAATIGTTSFTSFDPVAAIADIAEREQVWLHVDAAYAGPSAILEEMRPRFAGWERADSIIVNPHKWLFTPIDCSLLYTRKPEVLKRAFEIDRPAYLAAPEHPRAVNFSEYGLALGRRFRAIKLWFVMRSYGREGIAAILRNHLRWARELAGEIRADSNFEVIGDTPFSLVCFRYRGSDEENRALVERVNATGKLFLSGTLLQGRYVIRMAIGNVATTKADLDLGWSTVRECLPEIAAQAGR